MSPPTPDSRRAVAAHAAPSTVLLVGAALALLVALLAPSVVIAPATASAQTVPAYGLGPYESVRQAAPSTRSAPGSPPASSSP
jgi:hypothetical protein